MNAIAMRDIIRLKDICEVLDMVCPKSSEDRLEVHGRDPPHRRMS